MLRFFWRLFKGFVKLIFRLLIGGQRAAAKRKLGIRARFGYLAGAVLAGLWLFFYSFPTITEALTVQAELDAYAAQNPEFVPFAPPIPPDFFLLCFVLLSVGFVGYTAFRTSPFYIGRSEPFIVVGVLAAIGYVFKAEVPSSFNHTGQNEWNGLNWLAGRMFEIEHGYELLSSDFDWYSYEIWHSAVLLVLIGGVQWLIADNVKHFLRDDLVYAVGTLLGFAALLLYVHSEYRNLALKLLVFPIVIFPLYPFLAAMREYVKEAPLYRRLFVHGRGGSARFGGIYSFLKYDFGEVLSRRVMGRAPIYGGKTKFEEDPRLSCRHIGLNSDSMMLTVAAMGGGKSLCSAWNTLPIWRGGALVLDPKGEHADMTASSRRKRGKVYFLAPWTDRFEKATYNPLEDISLHHPNARSDLFKIVQACIPEDRGETANAKHFRESGQRILLGIIAHVLSTFPPEYHNLPCIYDTILTGHPDGGAADPKVFDDLVTQMAVNEALGRAPMDAAKLLQSAGENEGGGFQTTLANGMNWVNDEAIRPCIMKSSFSMKEIRRKRATVYLVIPFENMSENARYLRVMVGSALLACREESPYPESTLMLLDEFPQLGTFEPIKEGLVTLRSQKVKIWMMLQDIGQLKERYKNWQDFMSSCDKQFFAVNDSETAEAICKALGEYVDREVSPERTRPLRSHSEVLEELRKGSGIQYLMPADGNPMTLKLVPAYKNFSEIRRLSS